MNEWTTTPNSELISQTVEKLNSHNMETFVVDTKEEALAKLKSLIPAGKDVHTGSSTTLHQIGFMDHLKDETSGYNYLGDKVRAEDDEQTRIALRRQSITAQYFVTSVNAITQEGQLVAVDATGSRVGSIPFAAEHLIVVASANKIVENLDIAFKRIKEYVFPLEDKRMKSLYGENAASSLNKWVILEKEFTQGRTQIIIVKENLGF